MEYPNLSGEQFKSIVNLIKCIIGLVGGAITLMVTIALWLTYSDLKDMRDHLKDRTTEMKEEVSQIKAEVQLLSGFAQGQITDFRTYSNEQIDRAKENATVEARLAAYNKIQEVVGDDRGIRNMIESTAERMMKERLRQLVEEQLSFLPEMMALSDRITAGSRRSLEQIDSLRRNSDDEYIKNLAETIHQQKIDYFEHLYKNSIPQQIDEIRRILVASLNVNRPILLKIKDNPGFWYNFENNRDEIIQVLKNEVRKGQDLHQVATAFFALEHYLNIELELFNYEDFERKINQN